MSWRQQASFISQTRPFSFCSNDCGMQRKGREALGPLYVIISCSLNKANEITERMIVVWSHEHGHFDIDSLCLSRQNRQLYSWWVCFRHLHKGCKLMCELTVWQQEVVVTLWRAEMQYSCYFPVVWKLVVCCFYRPVYAHLRCCLKPSSIITPAKNASSLEGVTYE